MRSDHRHSLGGAFVDLCRSNGLDPEGASARSWTVLLGPVTLTLPNFRWRRRAIVVHDLHHLLTGYPCTMRGEFQLAAWEFAAGRFPHVAATLFCLPLIALGFLWSPRRMFAAYWSGRHSRSLYGLKRYDEILLRPVAEARDVYCPVPKGHADFREIAGFGVLLLQSALTVLVIPIAAAIVAMVL